MREVVERGETRTDKSVLPNGWVWTTVDDICEVNPRFAANQADPDLDVSFVPMKAVEEKSGRIDLSEERTVFELRKGYTAFANGDILFAKITPCMENGKIAVADNLKNGLGFGSTEFHVLRPKGSINQKFIFFYLLQDSFRNEAKRNMGGAVGQLRVPRSFIENTVIPLSPLSEQHRIVAKIEELLSDLDAGVEALRKAKAQLKRYRQALLKAACEGKLTEEWREGNKGKIAPASVILERMEAQRQQWTGKRSPISALTSSRLPRLPEGWAWATVEQLGVVGEQTVLTGPFGSTLGKEDFVSSGVPLLTIGCLTAHGLSTEKAFYVSEAKAQELERYKVKAGDLLFSRMATVGRADLVSSRFEGAVINYHLMRLRLAQSIVRPEFFVSYVRGSQAVKDFLKDVNHGATRPGINTSQLLALPVALPPVAEQDCINAEVERLLSVASEVEKTIDNSTTIAERLRQSILKKAFEGKLMPQDPNDEPAQKLLERIQAEKAKAEALGKTRKGAVGQLRLI